MFGWLKRKWRNRGRAIFRFWDGTRERCADPLVVHRALMAHPEFDWEKTPVLMDVDDQRVASDAMRVTAAGVRDAFGIPSLESGGLTEAECVQVLILFNLFLDRVKKNIGSPPTSLPATESAFSGTSTTKPASDCGSTSDGPKPAAATG